jgi:hypothetical protein
MNPLANYYLKFYSVTVTILWATTFSLAVLFIPKVYIFYKQWKVTATATEAADEYISFSPTTTACLGEEEDDDLTLYSFLKSAKKIIKDPLTLTPLATTLSTAINDDKDKDKGKDTTTVIEGRYDNTKVYVEVQEGDVPVRKTFKYFPFLSQWKMRRLMIFPRFGYISYYSEKTKKGTMISYSHASICNAEEDAFVLKIHGQDKYDVYIQLGDFITMESWKACLNQNIKKQQEKKEYFFKKQPFLPPSSSLSLSTTATVTATTTSSEESTCHYHRPHRRSKSQPLRDKSPYPELVSSISSSSLSSFFQNKTKENIT